MYGLCGDSVVAVVEPADLRTCDDTPGGRRHDRTRGRRVLEKREMCARAHVVHDVVRQDSMEPCHAEDDHVIETLTPNGTDHTLDVGVLPGRPRGCANGLDVHAGDGGPNSGEDGIAIMQ